MGKWFGAVSDVRKASQNNKKPPLFKKLFAAGSVEEEALALLIHEKTIKEQEAELQAEFFHAEMKPMYDECEELELNQ